MKRILLLIGLTAFLNLNSQINFQWAKSIGGTNADISNAIAVDVSGNTYIAGEFQGTADFDPGAGTFTMTSLGSTDVFIVKLDQNGNFVWAKAIAGTGAEYGKDIAVDAANNVYITGNFQGTPDFDPGAATYSLTSFGSTDAYVIKLDGSGNFIWAEQLGGNGADDGTGIALDATANVYVTGSFYSTADFDPSASTYTLVSAGGPDVFVIKLSTNGVFVWADAVGGLSNEYGYSIDVDNTNNVIATGRFTGTADFDPSASTFNLTSSGTFDIFILKLNNSGGFTWAKNMGGSSAAGEEPYQVKTDNFGNIISVGYYNGTADFDPGAGVFNLISNGLMDVYISKIDALGNFVWAKSIGAASNDMGLCVSLDPLGNIYSGGYFTGTVDFDPGTNVFNLTSIGGVDNFVLKLDANGNFAWAGSFGSTISDLLYGIALQNGNIFTTGVYNLTADFDPSVATFTITSAGNSDSFVQKLCQIPNQPLSISGPTSICQGSTGNYSIANVYGATSYSWSLPASWSGSSSSASINATAGNTNGIITVTAINSCGSSLSQTLSVTINPSPTISVNSGTICSGQSFTINPNGASTYTISGGNAVVSPTTTTSYTVVGTNTLGCTSAQVISNVTVSPAPSLTATTTSSIICGPPFQQTATLTANGASSYTWNPGGSATNITVSPSVTTTYTLMGTSVAGCTNSTTFTQSVSACTNLGAINGNANEFVIFPNPSQGKVHIISKVISEEIQFTIYNGLGQLISREKPITSEFIIDIENKPDGFYYLKIHDNDKLIHVSKIIKQ